MPNDTGERVDDVFDFPGRHGRVHATRVHYEPDGFTPIPHRHPAGAYVYVLEGSVVFGIEDDDPVVLKAGDTFYEPPGVLHAVSRNASQSEPASLLAFFVLDEGEEPTVYEHE